MNLVIGENLFWKDVLEALVAWKSLGNSTWYIFAILCLYGLTFVAGKISNNYKVLALLVTVGALLYILILKLVGKESHWYNTALCYPAGMFYAIYADRINAYFDDNRAKQILALVVSAVFFALFYKIDIPVVRLLSYQFAAITFALGIVVFTMIFVVDNAVLRFLGKYLFEIYILQRIPMILLQQSILNKYIYFILCFVITLILAVGFKMINKRIDHLVDYIFVRRVIVAH